MRKIFFVIAVLILALTGCGGSSGSLKVSEKDEFKIAGYRIKVDSAKIDDGKLVVTAKWSFGTNEDSSKKENFASSGILFSANQSGKELQSDLSDSGIYKDNYEMSDSSIYPTFELENESDSVELKFFNPVTSESKSIEISL